MKKTLKNMFPKSFLISTLAFGVLFSLILLFGNTCYDFTPQTMLVFTKEQIVTNILYMLKYLLLFFAAMALFQAVVKCNFLNKTVKNPKTVWVAAPILFTLYFVVYLAYFPGTTGYDAYMQIPMALGEEAMTNHHPILHTLFIGACLRIGNLFRYKAAGLVVYSVIQIALLSTGITYAMYISVKNSNKIKSLLLPLLWFSLYPTFALFSFNMTKDVLFSALFNLFVLTYYLGMKKDKLTKAEFAQILIFGILSALLRNNAVYVLIIFLFPILFIKKNKKRNIMCLLIPIVLSLTINNFLLPVLNIEKSPAQESIAVPIQQITSVYALRNGELDEETKEEILEYIPKAGELFNPSQVDHVKYYFNTQKYNEDKVGFWKLWFKLFGQFSKHMIRYGVMLNVESFVPEYEFLDEYYHTDYIDLDYSEDYFGEQRANLLTKIKNDGDRYAKYDYPVMQKGAGKMLFSLSMPFTLLYIFVANAFGNGEYKKLLYFAPFVLLWLSYMVGPLSNLRYFLPILMMLPFGISILWEKKEEAGI